MRSSALTKLLKPSPTLLRPCVGDVFLCDLPPVLAKLPRLCVLLLWHILLLLQAALPGVGAGVSGVGRSRLSCAFEATDDDGAPSVAFISASSSSTLSLVERCSPFRIETVLSCGHGGVTRLLGIVCAAPASPLPT